MVLFVRPSCGCCGHVAGTTPRPASARPWMALQPGACAASAAPHAVHPCCAGASSPSPSKHLSSWSSQSLSSSAGITCCCCAAITRAGPDIPLARLLSSTGRRRPLPARGDGCTLIGCSILVRCFAERCCRRGQRKPDASPPPSIGRELNRAEETCKLWATNGGRSVHWWQVSACVTEEGLRTK